MFAVLDICVSMIIIMIDEALCCTRLREMIIIILVDEALCCTRLNCIMVITYTLYIYMWAHMCVYMLCTCHMYIIILNTYLPRVEAVWQAEGRKDVDKTDRRTRTETENRDKDRDTRFFDCLVEIHIDGGKP